MLDRLPALPDYMYWLDRMRVTRSPASALIIRNRSLTRERYESDEAEVEAAAVAMAEHQQLQPL